MSAVKDKSKKHHHGQPAANEVVEQAGRRKSRRASKKVAKTVAPKELISAVKEGRVEVIQKMLEADVSLKRSYTDVESKQTLLHAAIRTGLFPVVDCLISAGVSTLDVDLKFRNALHFLARIKDPSEELIERIIGLEGLQLSAEDVDGATPLHLAIRFSNTRVAEALINTPGMYLVTMLAHPFHTLNILFNNPNFVSSFFRRFYRCWRRCWPHSSPIRMP